MTQLIQQFSCLLKKRKETSFIFHSRLKKPHTFRYHLTSQNFNVHFYSLQLMAVWKQEPETGSWRSPFPSTNIEVGDCRYNGSSPARLTSLRVPEVLVSKIWHMLELRFDYMGYTYFDTVEKRKNKRIIEMKKKGYSSTRIRSYKISQWPFR